MADGTVRGAFDLDTSRARREVRAYRRDAAAADTQTRQLGSSIENAFGQRQVQGIERVGRATSDLARDTYRTRMEVRDQWRGMRRDVEREAAGIVSTIAVVRDRMRALSREKATPTVDVAGITQALAQVELLHSRLNALSRSTATPRVALGGGFGGGAATSVARAAGAGGRGGGSGILNLGGVGFAGIRGGTLAAIGGLALPAVSSLAGGAGALGGSLGSAAFGAGATGLGGMGPLVAGIAGVMSVAKPAQEALKEASAQQERLTKAVAEYGKNSKQARVESERLDRLTRGRPGMGYAMQQRQGFGRDWRRLTAAGQQDYYGLLGDVASVGRRAAPALAPLANRTMRATRASGTQYARSLAGDESLSHLAFFSRSFARELPVAERSLENITIGTMRMARAATPFFREANAWVETQTAGWAESNRNIGQTTDRMRPLVRSAKDWARLLGSSWDLLKTIGNAGRPAGDSMVRDLDQTFERWDAWMQSNPEQTRGFFRESANSVREMARGLSSAVGYMRDLADVLRPVLDRFSQLLGLVSSLGLTGAPGLVAGLVGGVRGGRGAMGAGAAAMGLAGPGAAAAGLFGAARGVRGVGVPSQLGVAGVSPLAGQRTYGAGFRYGGPVSQLGPRATRFGGGLRVAGSALRGAGKAAWPIGLGLAALDFASFDGGMGDRAQAALSSASFGMVPRPLTGDEKQDQGRQWFTENWDSRFRDVRGPRAQLGMLEREQAALAGHRGADFMFGQRPGDDAPSQVIESKEGVRAYIASLNDEIDVRRRLVKQIDAERERRRDDRSRTRALQYGAGIGQAFGVYRRAGMGRTEAGEQTVGQIRKRMNHMRAAGVEVLGEASLDWANAMAKKHPEMKAQVDDLTAAIVARYRRMGKRIRIINGDILTGSRQEWGQIAGALTSASETARQGVEDDFTAIQNKAVGSLRAMGFSGPDARGLVQSMESGGKAGKAARNVSQHGSAVPFSPGYLATATGKDNARGGMIGGRGLMDTVPTPDGGRAAPGEAWIANRHTLHDISRATTAMYGLTAQQMIRSEDRRHAMPMGSGTRRQGRKRYAFGGAAEAGVGSAIVGIPWAPGEEIAASILGIVTQLHNRFGVGVSDAFDRDRSAGHVSPGHNVTGTAVDFTGSPAQTNALVQWAVAHGYKTLYDGSFGSTAWPNHGPGNHAHIEFGGASGRATGLGGMSLAGVVGSGVRGAGRINLGGAGRRQRGMPGALRQRAGDMYAAAMEQRINSALAAGAGATITGGRSNYTGPLNRRFPMHFPGQPGVRFSPEQVSMIASSVGLPGSTFAQIARGESGYFPGIQQRDPGDGMVGYGLWQMTPNAWGSGSAAYKYMQSLGGIGAMFNPVRNAEMAKYLYDAAGGSIRPWYGTRYVTGPQRSRGGKVTGGEQMAWGGLFANGGSMVTNGPTMFMAGEGHRRRERVTVTPAGSRGHGGDRANVTFEAGAVVVKLEMSGTGEADIEAVAEKVGERIVGKIIEGIDKAKRGGTD